MQRLIARVGLVAAAAIATASIALTGAGPAAADALTGRTYGDASATISEWNATPVVATVNGSQLPKDKCIVTHWQRSTSPSSTSDVLLDLNCNASVASAGKPGNSAMSPEGRQAKKDQAAADYINDDDSKCYESDKNLSYCKAVCSRTGDCEVQP